MSWFPRLFGHVSYLITIPPPSLQNSCLLEFKLLQTESFFSIIKQTVSWLTSAPSVLKDCLQVLYNPNDLKSLLQHHKCLEHLSTQGKSVSHFKAVQSLLSHF